METVDPKKDRLPIKIHSFLRRNLFFYRPWTIYWMLYFGPWTWLFRALSWVIPKKKGLIVFGSNEGKHFSDNSRSLFEYIQATDESIRAVWFTNKKEVYREVEEKYPDKVVMSPSFKAAFLYLRAEQAVISFGYQDLCKMPWIPSIKINQLWHGVPLKKIGLLRAKNKTDEDYGETSRLFIQWCGKVDRFFVASEYEKRNHSLAFDLPESCFRITGNPRNDRLYSKSSPLDSDVTTILYAPTFRERGDGPGNHIRILMHPEMDEQSIHNFLKEKNCKLIVRPHWITHPHQYSSDRIHTISHFEEPDLYNLFSVSDILVTDYSSAFIDWLILDKPVIFTPYDLEEYERKNGLLEEYHKLVPQPICRSPDEILTSLEEAISYPDKYRDERKSMKLKYLGEEGYGASKRVFKIMMTKNELSD